MGTMRIADVKAGDLKVIWDRTKRDEVDVAREQFDSLLKKGYVAYSVDKKGAKGKKITEFDKDLEMLILAPGLVGG